MALLRLALGSGNASEPATVIVEGDRPPPALRLAAREAQRYVWVRTGELLPIAAQTPRGADVIFLAIDSGLAQEAYRLKTMTEGGRRILRVHGGSEVAVLYGVYQLAEHLGIRFHLHGDVVPDERTRWSLPDLDETHAPLFDTRGIQPFHDFTEGPDWWSLDDYRLHLSQMVKMRMNWIGFHCYPEGGVGPEPLVWIGLPEDVNPDGTVRFSYPSRWASASGGSWGYSPARTGDFAAGAALLFAEDDFGSPVTDGYRPLPTTVEASNAVFNRAGHLLREAFTDARRLGIRTCIGTETPLTIPQALRQRLQDQGLDPTAPETIRRLYRGMFERIHRTHPLDTYWLWTPEGWTWEEVSEAALNHTVEDVRMALEALNEARDPFGFATCGWVLGPPADRTLFDKLLPKSAAIGCINRQVGFEPVDTGFLQVQNRPQWAIPWVEDDPAMIIPQFHVGRLRRDAADAHAYGCTGLMGIHWRTRVLAPNFLALARAAWTQAPWNARFGKPVVLDTTLVPDTRAGGKRASFTAPIAGTDDDSVFQTCVYDLNGYTLAIPNGVYDVTLQFCEAAYDAPGRRVFSASVQGQSVASALDVFDQVGKNHAFELTTAGVLVDHERLQIDFQRAVEFPFIAGIRIQGVTRPSNQFAARAFDRRINCGGDAVAGYEADLPISRSGVPFGDLPRDLPCEDLYTDWCRSEFGAEAAVELAGLFTRLDGGPDHYHEGKQTRLPRPADWLEGPGGIPANTTPWHQEQARYAFVEAFEALRPQIRGAGNLARFDYWRNSLRYLRAVGEIGCLRGKLDQTMKELAAETDPELQRARTQADALPLRLALARAWERMMTWQLGAVETIGEIGTIANLEQHVRRNNRNVAFQAFNHHDAQLQDWLREPLPAEAEPTRDYLGQPRLIVTTPRPHALAGESLTLQVVVLDAQRPRSASLHWRPLGQRDFQPIPLEHVARGRHTVQLPPADRTFEYFLQAETADGRALVWPATAPDLNQTVVVSE